MQAVAACGVGPVRVHVVPETVSLGVNVHDALEPLGEHAVVNVGAGVFTTMFETVPVPVLPAVSVPDTENEYVPFCRSV